MRVLADVEVLLGDAVVSDAAVVDLLQHAARRHYRQPAEVRDRDVVGGAGSGLELRVHLVARRVARDVDARPRRLLEAAEVAGCPVLGPRPDVHGATLGQRRSGRARNSGAPTHGCDRGAAREPQERLSADPLRCCCNARLLLRLMRRAMLPRVVDRRHQFPVGVGSRVDPATGTLHRAARQCVGKWRPQRWAGAA